MVGVAQLVELRIVTPAVVGSNPIVHPNAEVVKLVDTLDLGSSAERCESSSLSFRTIIQISMQYCNVGMSVSLSPVFVVHIIELSLYRNHERFFERDILVFTII